MAVALSGKFYPEVDIVIFVVIAAVSLGIFIAIVVASEVSRNKINPLPHVASSPPVPVHGCLSSIVAVPDPSGVEVDLRAVSMDRVPYWADLVRGATAQLLPAPVAPSILSDFARPLAFPPSQ